MESSIGENILIVNDNLKISYGYNISPRDFDLIFVSTDTNFTRGELNQNVFKDLGLNYPKFDGSVY